MELLSRLFFEPEMNVSLNRTNIVSNAKSIASGYDVLIAAHYLWNVRNHPGLNRTMRFLFNEVCGFPTNSRRPASLTRVMNILNEH
jgi:hypothetical protein